MSKKTHLNFPYFIGSAIIGSGVGDDFDCNYTTYSDGSKVPFDGDVPATGDIYSTITLELIGYRDPITFVFTPEPGTAEILELDGNDVSAGQVPKLNILDDIPVKWVTSLGVEQNDSDPVLTFDTYPADIDVIREGVIATYSHKNGPPIPFLKSYFLDDGITEVDFLGVYEIPYTVSNPVKFGWTITNGNVIGEVEQTTFSESVNVGETETVTMPTFTDDWGNSATLVSREQIVAREQAVVISVPTEGELLNDAVSIPVNWTDKYGTPVADTEPVISHETPVNVPITRGDVGNQDTVTVSHKDGIPVATLLYYRDDLNVRVDFNGTFVVPETVTSPVTFGWGVTNGNVVGEVEQAEFDQAVVTGLNDIIMLPEFTDDWGNTIGLAGRTQSTDYSSGGYVSPYAVDNDSVMNWDSLNTDSFTISGTAPNETFDDWVDTGSDSVGGLLKTYTDLPPNYDTTVYGEVAPTGNLADERALSYNETGSECWIGGACTYSLIYSCIIASEASPEGLAGRSDITNGGLTFFTYDDGRVVAYWKDVGGSNFTQVFSGFPLNSLVNIIVVVINDAFTIYTAQGNRTGTFFPWTGSEQMTVLKSQTNVNNKFSAGHFNQMTVYDTAIDAPTRAIYLAELETKYGGA